MGARLTRAQREKLLARVRKICLSFPETSERLSHGEAAFFSRGSLWIAAPLGAQDTLVRSDPAHYFVPPYVGYPGWVGATLDNAPDWDQLERIIADADALVTGPKRTKVRT